MRKHSSKRTSEEPEETEELEFNIEEEIEIDADNLFEEWINHPNKYLRCAKLTRRLQKKAKFADERVKTLRSKLVMEANEDPEETLGKGIKPTAPNVEAYYRNHKDYRVAKKQLIEAQEEADLANDYLTILQHRKNALENLVKMEHGEYHSSPREPRETPEAAEKISRLKKDSSNSKVRRRMNAD